MDIKFRYFSCKAGHAVRRFGTDVFIGAVRTIKGFEWDESKIVPIPSNEIARYIREYNRVIKDGALIEHSQTDYDEWIKSTKEDTASKAEDSEIKQDEPIFSKDSVKKRKTGGQK